MPYPDIYKSRQGKDSGFTLVEILVVFIIVGILIAAVVWGLNLLRASHLTSTYMRTQVFESALEEFIQKYGALPGDMNNARARLPVCGSVATCPNGNGNGVIGNAALTIFDAGAPAGAEVESTAFWYHLQAAQLINGVAINTNIALGTGWGQSHPEAPYGGGYQIRAMNGISAYPNGEKFEGIFVRWQAAPYVATNAAAGFVITPGSASYLDVKFDDGNPISGAIQSLGTAAMAGLGAADGCRATATTYVLGEQAYTCYMIFRIRESSGL